MRKGKRPPLLLLAATIVAGGIIPSAHATLNAGNGTLSTFSWDTTKNLFVFGDSWSTTGWGPAAKGANSTDYDITTANGPNWVDFLSRKYNETTVYTRNFATSGATIANEYVGIKDHPMPFKNQVLSFEQYFSPAPATVPWQSESALFASFIGINDVGLGYALPNQTGMHAKEFVVWTQLQERLYTAGARHFLVVNVPPTYRTPTFLNNGRDNADLKASLADYNTQLQANAVAFQLKHPDAVVMLFDAFESVGKLLDNALTTGGFKNVTSNCPGYFGGTTTPTSLVPSCVNPINEYFWFDSYHPNSPAHLQIAQQVRQFLDSPFRVATTQSNEKLIGSGTAGVVMQGSDPVAIPLVKKERERGRKLRFKKRMNV
ncbi:hypothetical protein T439DRAFT_352931 [Meredithblackwellia eburnea MCA 4105]